MEPARDAMLEAARPHPVQLTHSLLSPADLERLSDGPLTPTRPSSWNANDLDYIEGESDARARVAVPYEHTRGFSWRLFFKYAGPGWLMSLAYLDPGNIEADLQAGAYAGYSLLWVLLLCHLIGYVVQVLAARLGVVNGRNLAELCKLEYSGARRWTLWIMAELAIIGSDIQEVVGSAIAFQLLFGWPLWVGCVVTACDSFTFLALHFLGVRTFEAFVAVLIGTIAISFSLDCALARPDPLAVLSGFVPEVKSYAVLQAVGTLGSVIMPHNIFLHSALVQSRRIDHTSTPHVQQANMYNAAESAMALLVSFLINAAIVCCFAQGFFAPECAELRLACLPPEQPGAQGGAAGGAAGGAIPCVAGGTAGTCDQVGLSQAGAALHRLLPGSAARMLWAVGLLAAGQSSTMTGTLAGQYVMEGFLALRIDRWKRVLITRSLALGPAVVVALLCQASPSAGDTADEWLNVLQSVQLPFAVLPLIIFSSDRRIMGGFVVRGWAQAALWLLVALIIAVNFYLVSLFMLDTDLPRAPWSYTLVLLLGGAYLGFLASLVAPTLREALGGAAAHAESAESSSAVRVTSAGQGAFYGQAINGAAHHSHGDEHAGADAGGGDALMRTSRAS